MPDTLLIRAREFLSQTVGVSLILPHPGYSPDVSDANDIAVLKLDTTVDLRTHTPVCLPAAAGGDAFTGRTAWVTGEEEGGAGGGGAGAGVSERGRQ